MLEGKEVTPKILETKDSNIPVGITKSKQSTRGFDIEKIIQKKEPLSKLDSDKMQKMLEGKEVTPKILEKKDSNISVRIPKGPLSKLDHDKMQEMLNKETEIDSFKEFYIIESQRAFATTKFLDKTISDNPEMSSKTIEIINKLKELYELRGTYYLNKLNNDLEKNKHIDIFLIDNNINQLQDEFRYQEGSSVFTSQNEFVGLLILLTQLRTKANSKKCLKMI